METRTLDTAGNDLAPQQLIRYQLGNHLGSASLELDVQAQIISYEEYFPYGSTSYQAVRSQTETAKRYRYSGKERDEESGLCYYGARYLAPWLARWVSCDPLLQIDGPNLYLFCLGNPICKQDKIGLRTHTVTETEVSTEVAIDQTTPDPSDLTDLEDTLARSSMDASTATEATTALNETVGNTATDVTTTELATSWQTLKDLVMEKLAATNPLTIMAPLARLGILATLLYADNPSFSEDYMPVFHGTNTPGSEGILLRGCLKSFEGLNFMPVVSP